MFKESTASAEALEIGNSVKNPSAFKKSSSNPNAHGHRTHKKSGLVEVGPGARVFILRAQARPGTVQHRPCGSQLQ